MHTSRYVYLFVHICYFVYTGHVIAMKILQFLSLLLWTLSSISKIAGQFQSRGKCEFFVISNCCCS